MSEKQFKIRMKIPKKSKNLCSKSRMYIYCICIAYGNAVGLPVSGWDDDDDEVQI